MLLEIHNNKVAWKKAHTRLTYLSGDFRTITDFLAELLDIARIDDFNLMIDRYPTKEEFTEMVGSYFELSNQKSALEEQAKEAGLDLIV